MKRAGIVPAALVLAVALAGCGGSDGPETDPTGTLSPPVSEAPTVTATPEPTWDDKFTPAQLKNYAAARDVWLEYWSAYTDAARTGADTPGVRAMFEKFSVTPLSERSEFLDTYVRGGARMEVPPKVLWTSATAISPTRVVFNYCLDYSDARITTNGHVNEISDPSRRLVKVQMVKTTESWKKKGYVDSEVRGCAKTAP